MTIFYTYVLRDPRDFEPIYVGKGSGNNKRMRSHWNHMLRVSAPKHNSKLYSKLTSIFLAGYPAPIYEKLLQCDDEKACLLLERFLIKSIGRKNLCNLTDGGDGASGAIRSEETRAKMRGPKNDDHRRKIGEAQLGAKHWNFGKQNSEESNRKNSLSNLGKKHSEETKRKLSETNRGKRPSEECMQKCREATLGKPRSKESCLKQSQTMRGTHPSEETLQKMRKAWVIRRANTTPEQYHERSLKWAATWAKRKAGVLT